MRCPTPDCKGKVRVLDSRDVYGNRRRRRYECDTCPNCFTTIEEIIERGSLRQRDQEHVQLVRQRIRVAVLKAIEDA